MDDFGIVVPFEPYDTDVWSGRRIDFDQYRYVCRAWDIKHLAIVNRTTYAVGSDNLPNPSEIDSTLDITIWPNYAEFFKQHMDDPFVAFETEWTIPPECEPVPLNNLSHLRVGWYVFGPADGFTPRPTELNIRWSFMPVKPRIAFHTTHVVTAVCWDRELWLKHLGE